MDTNKMDDPMDRIRHFVESLAKAQELLIHFRRCLSLLPSVQNAMILTSINRYEVSGNNGVDIYVSIDLIDNNMVDWCLETTVSESGIQIETSIRMNHSRGNDIIKDFPVQYACTNEEFEKALESAITSLLAVKSVECSEVRPEDLVVLNKLLASLPDDVMA